MSVNERDKGGIERDLFFDQTMDRIGNGKSLFDEDYIRTEVHIH